MGGLPPLPYPWAMFGSPAARMRCVRVLSWPMNVYRSEVMRCTGTFGLAKAPSGLATGVSPAPPAVHGHRDERVNQVVPWRDVCCRYGSHAADGGLILLRPARGADLLELLNIHPVRDTDRNWPTVVRYGTAPLPPVGVPGLKVPNVAWPNIRLVESLSRQ